MKIIVRLAINAFALWIVSYLIPGFTFESTSSLIVTAVVFGVFNTFLRPVLQIVALPITILTFGVAAFLINVFLLWVTSFVVPGFDISDFTTAAIGSVVLSLTSWFLHKLEKNQ